MIQSRDFEFQHCLQKKNTGNNQNARYWMTALSLLLSH